MLVPRAIWQPVVDEWLATFETLQAALDVLAAGSEFSADGWRKRLQQYWPTANAVDVAEIDALLVAMGRVDLWTSVFSAYDQQASGTVSNKVRIVGERGRIKRQSKASFLTKEQVFAVHKLHVEGGLSMREIARRGWKTWGYASEHSCLNAVIDLLESYGLARRDRIEATIAASTTHGRGSRADKAAYKRWHRRAFGAWASDTRGGGRVLKQQGEPVGRVCVAVKKNAPRAGAPCSRYALHDSDLCFNHDPRNAESQVERLADLRSRIAA